MNTPPNASIRKPIFMRWWFWPALIVLFALVWYFQGYMEWFGDQAKYRLQNDIANKYIASQEKKQAELEAAYKNDPYGGATPEETLKLFVAALEKKDYTLAANYFVPEMVASFKGKIAEGVASGGFQTMVAVYNPSTVKVQTSGNYAEVKFKSANEGAPYDLRMVRNTYSNKWLISEL